MTDKRSVVVTVAVDPGSVHNHRSTVEQHEVTLLDDGSLRVGVSSDEVVIYAAGHWRYVHTRAGVTFVDEEVQS